MDSASILQVINSIWPLLFAATRRDLTAGEKKEIRRLVGLLEEGIPGRDAFNGKVDQFCLGLHSCGLLDSERQGPLQTGNLLLRLDELRHSLD